MAGFFQKLLPGSIAAKLCKGWDMADKTKAVALNRQCGYEYRKTKPFDLTRAVAGGQILNAPVITGTAPLARLACRDAEQTRYPQIWGDLIQHIRCTAMPYTRYPDFGFHPLGSKPRCCSSLRMMRLIHAASDSSPSCCCACSISSRRSGSSRNWNGGLPRLSFLCVDTSITPDVMCLCVMTHYIHEIQIATPRSAGTLPRRLTNNVNRSNAMAKPQCNQTHPKFTWRFLALNRHDKKATPCRLSVDAATEREARQILSPHFILSLAARLPIREVIHG